jgi:hypothetical protein
MNFDVYCDESRPDVIHSHSPNGSRLIIGSLWIPYDSRKNLKEAIHELRNKHRIGGEFKWNKVTHSRLDFYNELISYFFSRGDELRFRCISVGRDRIDLITFHQGDQELGFYKFYYQLLHHWLVDFNDYNIFLDYKRNHDRKRLPVLMRCLRLANVTSNVCNLQSIQSEESVLVQMADVLTGAVSAKLNQSLSVGSAKTALVNTLEQHLGHAIMPTSKSEKKFNVFEIIPGGGW